MAEVGPVELDLRPRSERIGDEAVRLVRRIADAYYADSCLWGSPGVGEDDARRFMRSYESIMGSASADLQKAVLLQRQPTQLEVP